MFPRYIMSKYMQIDIRLTPFYDNSFEEKFPRIAELLDRIPYGEHRKRELSLYEMIDVEIGHAAPLVADWDGDGVRDLLVGQFQGGHLRIYRKVGTDTEPRFAGFEKLRTGKELASVPSG